MLTGKTDSSHCDTALQGMTVTGSYKFLNVLGLSGSNMYLSQCNRLIVQQGFFE